MARISEAVKKTLAERATKGKTESKSPSSGGMKKDVQVKTHTRRTKSGKVTTVKAHTAKREAASQAPGRGGKSSAKGKELKTQRLQKAGKAFDEANELGVQYLETITEGTLKYKKEKDSFNTLVNAISALCTKKKGKYGFSNEEAPIEGTLMKTRSNFSVDFYDAVCSGVRKKLGASITSAPPSVVKELSRKADTPVKFNRAKEVRRLSDNLYGHSNHSFDLKEEMKVIRESPDKLWRHQKDLLKKY